MHRLRNSDKVRLLYPGLGEQKRNPHTFYNSHLTIQSYKSQFTFNNSILHRLRTRKCAFAMAKTHHKSMCAVTETLNGKSNRICFNGQTPTERMVYIVNPTELWVGYLLYLGNLYHGSTYLDSCQRSIIIDKIRRKPWIYIPTTSIICTPTPKAPEHHYIKSHRNHIGFNGTKSPCVRSIIQS
eukprot:171003_1